MLHVYFTGSAGNVTAGKYNDGTHANRARPGRPGPRGDGRRRPRRRATTSGRSTPRWDDAPVPLRPREDLDLDQLKAIVADPKQTVVNRNRNAMACGWLIRLATRRPILLSRLDLGAVTLLHLPPRRSWSTSSTPRRSGPTRSSPRPPTATAALVHPAEAALPRGATSRRSRWSPKRARRATGRPSNALENGKTPDESASNGPPSYLVVCWGSAPGNSCRRG